MENLQTKQINNYKPKINTMKKTTQNVTKSIWRSGLLAFVFLCSLSINSQAVGDEYVINPGLNTNGASWTMNANFSNTKPATSIGWTDYSSAGYFDTNPSPAPGNEGACHSEDRMLKLFKKGNAAGQFVTQEIEDLPSGNYNWSFWTKWATLVDYDVPGPAGAYEPTFTIATDDDADGTWEVVQTVITTQPSLAHTWVQDTGTYNNEIARNVRIKFYKYGGIGNNAQTNLNQLMMIDDVSLQWQSTFTWPTNTTSLSALTQDGSSIAGFTASKTTYNITLAAGTSTVPSIVATPSSGSASVSYSNASSIPGTTTITVTAEDGSTTNITINFTASLIGVVGTEYVVNPNINTPETSPNTGVIGSGNFKATNLAGWFAAAGGSYAPSNADNGNGNCHSEDRMFKFNKYSESYATLRTEKLPIGIYSYSFWTKWAATETYAGSEGPKFTIKHQLDNATGSYTENLKDITTTQPTAVDTWVQQTGFFNNTIERKVQIKFYKNGGGNPASGGTPNSVSQNMFIDDVSLKFVGTNDWIGSIDSNWDTPGNWRNAAGTNSGIPPLDAKVFIPGGLSNYPTATSAVTVSSLTMGSGASFIASSDFTGAVTYNRTLGTNNWHLVSSPVVGETYDNDYVTTNQIASGVGNNRGIAPYNTSSNTWNYMEAGAIAATFIDGTGYSVKRSFGGDISFTGTLNTSDASVELSTEGNGFNLLGNPYLAYVSVAELIEEENIATGNENLLSEQTVWLWDQVANSYVQKNLAADLELAPGQGFFVKASSVGNFNFTKLMQSHHSSDTFQRPITRPEITIVMSNDTDTRSANIFYIDGTTTGFDNGYDSSIFGGVANEFVIYTHAVANGSGRNLGIQSLPDSNYENMVMPVGVNAVSGTAITISASTNNFPEGLKIFLEDKQDNSFTLLDADANFNTTLENDLNGIGRFYLHTNQSVLNINDTSLDNVSVFKVNNSLRVLGLQQGKASVKLFNILGRQVLNAAFESNGTKDISLPRLAKGVYIVQLETAEGKLNKKIILE